MSCVSPILVKNNNGVVMAACGRCMSCCIAKQSSLQFLAQKELLKVYKSGLGASFVTLTYNDNCVPYVSADLPYQTLQKDDFQKFMKRLRFESDKLNIKCKFIACGEYGDKLGRPHYHLALFGLSDALAQSIIKKVWTYGTSEIGALGAGGLRYVLKYMTKSRSTREIEQFYKINGVQKPFILHSQKLGFDWIYDNKDIIVKNHYTFVQRGVLRLYPKYVRDVVERLTGVDSRPYVADYLKHIDTKGETLDNYFSRMTYVKEIDNVKKSIQNQSAAMLPPSYRRPADMRNLTDCDYMSLVGLASE